MGTLFTNNLILITAAIALASLVGVGLLIFGIFRIMRASDVVHQRLQGMVDQREKTSTVDGNRYHATPRVLSGSFFSRTLTSNFKKILDLFGKYTPSNSIAKLDFDLRVAGNPYGMHAREFYGIRMIVVILGIGLALLNYSYSGSSSNSILLGLVIIAFTLLLPRMWLQSRVKARRQELSYNLPDALDMLSVSAIAGLSFDQGLRKICEVWPTTLSEEFKQVLQEMDMGISRTEALRNLRARIDLDALSSFIAIMIQAEATGMNYSEVLENEAKQMRIFRQFRAKETANSLPARMIIPVVLFIFPALILVILGPLLPALSNLFNR